MFWHRLSNQNLMAFCPQLGALSQKIAATVALRVTPSTRAFVPGSKAIPGSQNVIVDCRWAARDFARLRGH
jgi:hypothetical protein